MHQPVSRLGRWLQQVVTGYFNYHAVPTNSSTLTAFLFTLPISGGARCGSGARKTAWERLERLADDWLPKSLREVT
jgi:RNA-directed DNA polymerase